MQSPQQRRRNRDECGGFCDYPLEERINRSYAVRTDCGNATQASHDVPLITYSHPGQDGSSDTNAWCELNLQKQCADAIFNRDYLFVAKAVTRASDYDFWFCKYNGW